MGRFDNHPRFRKFDSHLWADYFELLCIYNKDKSLTYGEMPDRVRLVETDLIVNDEDQESNSSREKLPEEVDDQYEERFTNVFDQFKCRARKLGPNYPFEVAKNQLSLKSDLTNAQKTYIYLLICSHLSYFNDYQTDLTTDFEIISEQAMRALLPLSAVVHNIGKKRLNSNDQFKGNVFLKISKMCELLNETLKVTADDFPSQSTGDGGVDLLAWVPFSDGLKSLIIYAGQCKCSNNWKTANSPSDILTSFFTTTHKPTNIFFIPFFFRKSSGDWFEGYNLHDKILVDRQRMFDLLNFTDFDIKKISSYPAVESILLENESIV